MSDPRESGPARKAFEAYRETLDATQGIPEGEPRRWEAMPRRVQEAFRSAAHAGAMHYANEGLGRVGQRSEHAGFEGTYIACPGCGGHGLLILADDGDEMLSPVAVDYGVTRRDGLAQAPKPSRWRSLGPGVFTAPVGTPMPTGLAQVGTETALQAQESMPVEVEDGSGDG